MNEKMIRKYANMLAVVGINVQPGQKVLVEACIEGYQFANIFAQECYKRGSGEVIINYLDLAGLKTKAQYMPEEEVRKIINGTVADVEYGIHDPYDILPEDFVISSP